jgi:hypothetical protein
MEVNTEGSDGNSSDKSGLSAISTTDIERAFGFKTIWERVLKDLMTSFEDKVTGFCRFAGFEVFDVSGHMF